LNVSYHTASKGGESSVSSRNLIIRWV